MPQGLTTVRSLTSLHGENFLETLRAGGGGDRLRRECMETLEGTVLLTEKKGWKLEGAESRLLAVRQSMPIG